VSDRPTYVYTTYIESTPDRVWEALTDADLTGAYWGHRNESDWQVGSSWRHVRLDGSGIADVEGKVLESDPPRRLVTAWDGPAEPSIVTFAIEPFHEIVKLTVTHENVPGDDDYRAVSLGWPAVMANLKTMLETGKVMSRAPWTMHG
jgi:uncharacterized protein YndB with AHSA1/START domain